ncbi:DNA repair protein RecO [Sunxiuqinia sp. A32]|uniref:DNA repair protein RecO n=1 Tax=Sunxiuqinia sp. A32 TaxID=3461496 RepID=UPI004045AEB8
MLEKTRGIFLHHINYSESSIIARIYTEKFGRQSYIINGARGKKSNTKVNLFQPLFLLDMEVYHKPGRELQRLKEARIAIPFEHIPYDIRKSSQAIFLAEVLMRSLKEEEPNAELFDFLFHAACLLDLKSDGISNFHIVFLLKLTRYLGVFPHLKENFDNLFFDLLSASFKRTAPAHQQFMNVETSNNFRKLFKVEMSEIEKLSFTGNQRTVLLSKLLEYYNIHLDMKEEIKSLEVLKEVME